MKIITNIIIAVLAICNPELLMADNKEVSRQIRDIMVSNQYLYGDYTAATEREAREMAEEMLENNIKEWVVTKKKLRGSQNLVVNNKQSLQTSLSMSRGNMIRVFIYVKKSDIIAGNNAEIISQTPRIPSSTVEPIKSIGTGTKVQKKYPEVVTTIASYTEYKPMAEKIMQFKEQGKITRYARYTSLDKPDMYYLAVYNTAGKVVTVLTPGPTRYNVKTGEIDNVTNYSGCGAIGFIPRK